MINYTVYNCATNVTKYFSNTSQVRTYVWGKDLTKMAIFKNGFIIPFGYSSYNDGEFERTLEIFRPEAMR